MCSWSTDWDTFLRWLSCCRRGLAPAQIWSLCRYGEVCSLADRSTYSFVYKVELLIERVELNKQFYTVRHKKLHPSYCYNNLAKLCHTLIIFRNRCTWEYPIACLFDSLYKIKNWEPAYQICYSLLSSRQQRKMWNSCCNARPHTSSLQTYHGLTVLTLILWITGYVQCCSNVFIGNLLKTERW